MDGLIEYLRSEAKITSISVCIVYMGKMRFLFPWQEDLITEGSVFNPMGVEIAKPQGVLF